MMDLSDGLASDLPRLARASGVGFRIDGKSLPVRSGSTIEGACTDGEDYELLFTIPPDRVHALEARWAEAFPSVRLTRIGELTSPGAGTMHWSFHGYDHFIEP